MSLCYSEYLSRFKKHRTFLKVCCLMTILLNVSSGNPQDSDQPKHAQYLSIFCPSSCYCDESGEYVSCVGDGLNKFPVGVPNSTLRLEMRNYFVKEVSPDEFTTLRDVEELKLQQSHIEILQNETFSSNCRLTRLDLSQNALTSLSSSVFNSLASLRYLDLSSNLIEYVEQAFVNLANLEQLNLRDDKLQQLTANTFLGLHKVQYLNLDTNNISSIEVGTFQYLSNLAHLIISNNPLTTLSRLDFFGSRLQFIDISHVGLERIPQSLTKFVRDLRLAKNNLTHISAGDFDSYPYLGLLVLDDNCVSEIENDALGRQEYLMRLWLNGNCLTSVPPNLPPSLLALYIEENRLTDLPSFSFKGLVQLEQLFLQRNEIKNLAPCVFCDLVNLKSLDLQANQIENLTAGIFSNLTQLQTLDLSQNNLEYIDYRCFNGLTYLKTLQMSRIHSSIDLSEAIFDPLHNIQTLEVYDSSYLVHRILNSTRMLHGLRSVQELNIMHNRIIKLRADFPSFFPSLRIIKLSGNLWNCDENIQWLSNWIKQSNVQFYSSYNIRCATPEKVIFKPLMMLVQSDFYTLNELNTMTTQVLTAFDTSSVRPTTEPESSVYTEQNVYITNTSTSTSETLSDVKHADITPTIAVNLSHVYQYTIINDEARLVTAKPEANLTTSASEITLLPDTTTLKSEEDISANKTEASIQYMTSEDPSTNPASISESPHYTSLRTQNASDDIDVPKSINLQTISPQRRVLSSRLRVGAPPDENKSHETKTTVLFFITVATLVFFCLLLAGLSVSMCAKMRRDYQPVSHKKMRRASSISYYPQRDEVSIVTMSEGTVGHRTASHHGVGNKLYYIMENCGNSADATPDSQLQELLPQCNNDNAHVY